MTGRHAPGYPPEPVWYAEGRVNARRIQEAEEREAKREAQEHVNEERPAPRSAAGHVNAHTKKHA